MKDALGSVQSILVLGGTSEIAVATCKALAEGRTEKVVLAVRNPDRCGAQIEQLKAAGASSVEVVAFDGDDIDSHQQFVDSTFDRYGDFDLVLAAFAVLGDPDQYRTDSSAAAAVITTNFTGSVAVLTAVANKLTAQGHGTIVVLSSVAGERARKANYVYGASKAGLDTFAQGLGDSLQGSGVNVMVVRPGFVKTKMTEGMKPAPFSTTPEKVADATLAGLRKNAHTVWAPGILRWVMSIIRHLPRGLYRKMPV